MAAQSAPSPWDRNSRRRRPGALVLALVVNALILVGLLSLAPKIADMAKSGTKSFKLINVTDDQGKEEKKQAPRQQRQAAEERPAEVKPPPPVVLPPPPVAPPNAPPMPPNMIIMSRQDFASTDISKMARSAQSGTQTAQNGQGGADSEEVGQGPNGEQLYAADWHVRPRGNELAFYMPKNRRGSGWGEIICQTIPDYRVDNCRQLGESPRGSGLSSALRQAAWQFRVKPPRVGGRLLVGAWVRIHYDFYDGRSEQQQP
ncbi:protein TonB [Sphingomonas zeicaulis]|uniref:hypothetical protein n=1 Tax=Sphingomonas zeicaulis TaxID=1632740 RepID=UPI003D1F9230